MNEMILRQIFDRTKGHCHFCGDQITFELRGWRKDDPPGYWEVDHVIQRGKGGSELADNCLPACTRCNKLRWHRTGPQLRELLWFGVIACREIRCKTELGRTLQKLSEIRQQRNRLRRKAELV
jgi:hypothetical protein